MNITKKIIILSIIALVVAATTVYAIAHSQYRITNHVSGGLGVVTIRCVDNNDYNVNVTGTGDFDVDVSASVYALVINGQQINSPSSGPATLSSGTKVDVTWTSNMIAIIDPEII